MGGVREEVSGVVIVWEAEDAAGAEVRFGKAEPGAMVWGRGERGLSERGICQGKATEPRQRKISMEVIWRSDRNRDCSLCNRFGEINEQTGGFCMGWNTASFEMVTCSSLLQARVQARHIKVSNFVTIVVKRYFFRSDHILGTWKHCLS